MPKGIPKSGINKSWFKKGHKRGMMNRIHTEESKEKIKQANLERFKDGMPETTKEKISKSNKIAQNRLEVKEKNRQFHLGKEYPNRKSPPPFTKEHKENIKQGNLGQKRTKTTKRNISENHADMRGRKNPNWQGGKSFEIYSQDWTDDLKDSIRKRDNYICQECGVHQNEINYKLHCHHIDYDKKNCNPDNLITLCRKCHMKTNQNREYWINYFKNIKL